MKQVKDNRWQIVKVLRWIIGFYALGLPMFTFFFWMNNSEINISPILVIVEIIVWFPILLMMILIKKKNCYSLFKISSLIYTPYFIYSTSIMIYEKIKFSISIFSNPFLLIWIIVMAALMIGFIKSKKIQNNIH